jgi:hypothetical protein
MTGEKIRATRSCHQQVTGDESHDEPRRFNCVDLHRAAHLRC